MLNYLFKVMVFDLPNDYHWSLFFRLEKVSVTMNYATHSQSALHLLILNVCDILVPPELTVDKMIVYNIDIDTISARCEYIHTLF